MNKVTLQAFDDELEKIAWFLRGSPKAPEDTQKVQRQEFFNKQKRPDFVLDDKHDRAMAGLSGTDVEYYMDKHLDLADRRAATKWNKRTGESVKPGDVYNIRKGSYRHRKAV